MYTIIPGHMGYIHQQEILEQAAKNNNRKLIRDVVANLRNVLNRIGREQVDTACCDCCLQNSTCS